MDPVVVRGSFVTEDGKRIEGQVAFVPDLLWVMKGEQAFATYAPTVALVDGAFTVELTPTNTGYSRWRYTAITPAGVYRISVPKEGGPHYLKELIALSAKTP